MLLSLYLRFSTKPGQSLKIAGNIQQLGGGELTNAVEMNYHDHHHWKIDIQLTKEDLKKIDRLYYTYIYQDEEGNYLEDWGENRSIELSQLEEGAILLDTWIDMGAIENNFYTAPFKHIFIPHRKKTFKKDKKKKIVFRIQAPLLAQNEFLAVVGNNPSFGNWDASEAVKMKFDGHAWVAQVAKVSDTFYLEYKYCVINEKGELLRFETGSNRIVSQPINENLFIIQDGYLRTEDRFRGTGIAIPVFSIRTNKSFGVGEFQDIKALVDWAASVSIKMIQLLPVNDTTSTHTKADSYPYAAISAFALHPLYISLEKVAGTTHKKLIQKILDHKKELNASEGVCYEEVMKWKQEALQKIFQATNEDLFQNEVFLDFFQQNKSWLVPYAAFSYLRDKYQSSDVSKWEEFSDFNSTRIDKLTDKKSPHYKKIALHYFIQYHLHLQLKEAHEYANKKGIVLKGDIAIGVNRNGVDTWMDPTLYNLDMQAGAPPDDFAVKGQNWGFPTYNWKVMRKNQYAWWKQRFAQMSNYFDAFRIDHILGFFRIWSIPSHAVEGIMGRFVPAIPLRRDEVMQKVIHLSEERLCDPYITDTVLWEMAGGNEGEVKRFLRSLSDGSYRFKEEFDSQKKIELYFEELSESDHHQELKQLLFNLHSNIILHRDPEQKNQYHFRFNVHQTLSFHHLESFQQSALMELYQDYFFHRQELIWKQEALEKLPSLKRSTDMLICGEDLGMVPKSVPEVLSGLGFLCMEVQRMPKQLHVPFFNPEQSDYLAVVTPSTHDMSTIREWWTVDKKNAQLFFNQQLWQYGEAPHDANVHIVKSIVLQHLSSPAMWSVFQLQDLFAMDENLRLDNPSQERINIPGDCKHYWRYRMPINVEELKKMKEFNEQLNYFITSNGR
ncbi:MAG: 4-alpha-glucanotransferase [Chitinophagia bacterium]|nr:4-alpha-glucanotransferase [Chitinophagia bacterium]